MLQLAYEIVFLLFILLIFIFILKHNFGGRETV